VVLEALTRNARTGLPWEILYADDLVLMAESEQSLVEKVLAWKSCMESKGLKVNIGKTKVMIGAEGTGTIEARGKWPCGVCKKGVGSNSLKCTANNHWVHRKCSGIRGELAAVADTYICPACERGSDNRPEVPTSITVCQGVDIDVVGKFCYLGDMLNAEGGSDSSVTARIRCGWSKFKELSAFLTSKAPSFIQKGHVYAACVRTCMIYGTETWPMTVEQTARLDRSELQMLRRMCRVTLRDRISSIELRNRFGLQPMIDLLTKNRLRWYGHVHRMQDDNWVKKCQDIEIDGRKPSGRPKKAWQQCVSADMKRLGLTPNDALNRDKWRSAIGGKQRTRLNRNTAV
jgi:hypothetical protein